MMVNYITIYELFPAAMLLYYYSETAQLQLGHFFYSQKVKRVMVSLIHF